MQRANRIKRARQIETIKNITLVLLLIVAVLVAGSLYNDERIRIERATV